MEFIELSIKGAFLIKPSLFEDERGFFRRSFCVEEFSKYRIKTSFSQGNISENPFLGTLRGFHYQELPYKEAKTLTCLSGSIFDYIIDLRPNSESYLNCCSIEISAKDRNSIHIPDGCANAWITTDKNTIIHYYMSDPYAPTHAKGIKYNDPFFNLHWPLKPKIISSKDLSYPDFDPSCINKGDI